MQYRRKRNPEEVGGVGKGDPFNFWIDCEESPDECAEDEEDVDRGEKVVFEAELKISKGEIENEVEDKGHSDHCG